MEELLTQVAREVRSKYYGKYRAFVEDNDDPEHRGRLRLRIPSVLGDEVTGWALPCLPLGGLKNTGLFLVPEPESQVWAEFEEGDLAQPLWTGTFWQQQGDAPEEAAKTPPTTRVLKTPGGHALQFDDEPGKERVHIFHQSGAGLEINETGVVELTDPSGGIVKLNGDGNRVEIEDANGNSVVMSSSGTNVEDANGNRIEMASAGVTVEGAKIVVKGSQVVLGGDAGEPLIKGQSFLALFATHVHPTGVGPSGPPVPQGEMTTLSQKVMSS